MHISVASLTAVDAGERRRRIAVQLDYAKAVLEAPSCLGLAADWSRVGRRALGLVFACLPSNWVFWLPPQVAPLVAALWAVVGTKHMKFWPRRPDPA